MATSRRPASAPSSADCWHAVGTGAEKFFGEPALSIDDLLHVDSSGRGTVNILAADRLMSTPKVYATFLLWLLADLFEKLPEVGDIDKPKLVFFFDEAHLLFDEAPKIVLEKIEQVVRLIRSKGVGVFFVSQNPLDIPDTVFGQLGNRVQHALRAFTPKDQKAVRAAAQTFRNDGSVNVEQVISQLAVGEALCSFLDEAGSPLAGRSRQNCSAAQPLGGHRRRRAAANRPAIAAVRPLRKSGRSRECLRNAESPGVSGPEQPDSTPPGKDLGKGFGKAGGTGAQPASRNRGWSEVSGVLAGAGKVMNSRVSDRDHSRRARLARWRLATAAQKVIRGRFSCSQICLLACALEVSEAEMLPPLLRPGTRPVAWRSSRMDLKFVLGLEYRPRHGRARRGGIWNSLARQQGLAVVGPTPIRGNRNPME